MSGDLVTSWALSSRPQVCCSPPYSTHAAGRAGHYVQSGEGSRRTRDSSAVARGLRKRAGSNVQDSKSKAAVVRSAREFESSNVS